MRIILRDNRYNRHTSLDSKMEGTLLKRQQVRFIRVAPRAFGEDKDALLVRAHLLRGAVERLEGRLTIRTIDEYSPRERHEPAKEGHCFQRFLGSDTAVWREDTAKHEHVQLGLVIPDKYSGAGREMLDALNDIKLNPRGISHDPFEAASGGPLGYSSVAHEAENQRRNHSVGGAEEKRAVRGEASCKECCAGNLLAQGEEGKGDNDERANARRDIGEKRHGELRGRSIVLFIVGSLEL